METGNETKLKSSYLLRVLKGDYNPFTPNVIIINDQFIEYRRRNWYLISVDSKTFHFNNVVGVIVDKHLIGATIRIITSGHYEILVHGFSKSKANEVKDLCTQQIAYYN